MLGINRREGTASNETLISTDIIMLEVVQSMMVSQKRCLMGSDPFSKCLKIAKSESVPNIRQYVDGVDENDQSDYVDSHLNMCKELRDFHSKAQDHTQKPYLE